MKRIVSNEPARQRLACAPKPSGEGVACAPKPSGEGGACAPKPSGEGVACLLLALLLHACCINHALAAALVQPPPVVFSVEPEEGGKLVVLPVAPETANDPAKSLFGFRLNIQNNATDTVRLTNIRTTFIYADNAQFAKQFSRDQAIAADSSALVFLAPEESIALPNPPPPTVRIDLFFDGYALPKSITRGLAPYQAPTPDGKYLLPFSASDLGANQYVSHVAPHTGGDQFFGYDFHIQSWNASSFSSTKPGTDGSQNEHRVGWNIPIHAMADGVVLRVSQGWSNNPVPGQRALQRMGDTTSGAITDVKVTKLSDTRAASFVRLPAGTFKLSIWDLENEGRVFTERDAETGETITAGVADALTSSRLITAVRTAGGTLRLIAWAVDSDGLLDRLGDEDLESIDEVSLCKLSSNRFATCVRRQDDTLHLTVWQLSDSGFSFSPLAEVDAGVASSIATVALSETRLATSLRTAQGTLKVIIWEVLEDGSVTLDRRGEANGPEITKAVAVKAGSFLVTAARIASGDLKVTRWTISDDGESVTKESEAGAGQIQDLAIAGPFDDDSVVTAVVTGDGNYHNILWKSKDGSMLRWGDSAAGAIDRVSVDALDGALFVSGVRTGSGDLKLIAWHVGSGGGNSLVILHGNCRVLYAHMNENSISPAVAYPGAVVTAGQFLGRMGNSGSSSGPHTHIHSTRVAPFLTIEEIIQMEADATLPLLAYRPIPFHCARALRMDAINAQSVAEENTQPFTELQGHGVYFAQFGIQPTWFRELYVDGSSPCVLPTGRLDTVNLGRLCFGGPFHQVNPALDAACATRQLFIRAGSYNEDVTFNRRVTVRSYDGTAVIGQ